MPSNQRAAGGKRVCTRQRRALQARVRVVVFAPRCEVAVVEAATAAMGLRYAAARAEGILRLLLNMIIIMAVSCCNGSTSTRSTAHANFSNWAMLMGDF